MSDLHAAPPAARVSGRPGGGSAIDGQGMTPGRARNRWTLVLAGLGAFMAALDVVVVATALTTLQSRLGASLADLEWTINAYNLVFGCLMLTGAALGDRFGRRRRIQACRMDRGHGSGRGGRRGRARPAQGEAAR